jgi:hypothetical protein
MEEFKIGDEVEIDGNYAAHLTGMRGIIIEKKENNWVGIEFNTEIDPGHDCGRKGKKNSCWYMKEEHCKKVDPEVRQQDAYLKRGEILHDIFYKSIYEESDYSALEEVLDDAMEQASVTKGKERHANNNRYEDQVICVVQRLLKDHPFGGHAYQIIKKTIEAGRLYKIKGKEAAYQEMLGAINYGAAMNILIKEEG